MPAGFSGSLELVAGVDPSFDRYLFPRRNPTQLIWVPKARR
jgi:hypothetical protein